MQKSYKTVLIENDDEFIEKRSRFIGYAKPVKTEKEAVEYINSIKSKHWDATHNVYAYVLQENQIKRYSDDGEPQGTAGIPVLDVILKSDVTDVCVVVTRYFGGIMLGAGGLVRAYSHGAKIALDAAQIIKMQECNNCTLCCSYNQYGKINTLIPACGGVVDDSRFLDDVAIDFHISDDNLGSFNKKLADLTCGSVECEIISKQYYQTEL